MSESVAESIIEKVAGDVNIDIKISEPDRKNNNTVLYFLLGLALVGGLTWLAIKPKEKKKKEEEEDKTKIPADREKEKEKEKEPPNKEPPITDRGLGEILDRTYGTEFIPNSDPTLLLLIPGALGLIPFTRFVYSQIQGIPMQRIGNIPNPILDYPIDEIPDEILDETAIVIEEVTNDIIKNRPDIVQDAENLNKLKQHRLDLQNKYNKMIEKNPKPQISIKKIPPSIPPKPKKGMQKLSLKKPPVENKISIQEILPINNPLFINIEKNLMNIDINSGESLDIHDTSEGTIVDSINDEESSTSSGVYLDDIAEIEFEEALEEKKIISEDIPASEEEIKIKDRDLNEKITEYAKQYEQTHGKEDIDEEKMKIANEILEQPQIHFIVNQSGGKKLEERISNMVPNIGSGNVRQLTQVLTEENINLIKQQPKSNEILINLCLKLALDNPPNKPESEPEKKDLGNRLQSGDLSIPQKITESHNYYIQQNIKHREFIRNLVKEKGVGILPSSEPKKPLEMTKKPPPRLSLREVPKFMSTTISFDKKIVNAPEKTEFEITKEQNEEQIKEAEEIVKKVENNFRNQSDIVFNVPEDIYHIMPINSFPEIVNYSNMMKFIEKYLNDHELALSLFRESNVNTDVNILKQEIINLFKNEADRVLKEYKELIAKFIINIRYPEPIGEGIKPLAIDKIKELLILILNGPEVITQDKNNKEKIIRHRPIYNFYYRLSKLFGLSTGGGKRPQLNKFLNDVMDFMREFKQKISSDFLGDILNLQKSVENMTDKKNVAELLKFIISKTNNDPQILQQINLITSNITSMDAFINRIIEYNKLILKLMKGKKLSAAQLKRYHILKDEFKIVFDILNSNDFYTINNLLSRYYNN